VSSVKIHIEPDSEASRFISSHMDFEPASIHDCDFVLSSRLPWGTVDHRTIQAALGAPPFYSKTTLAFLVTDSCDQFDIPENIILFRTSFYKSKKHPNERLLPYIWEAVPTEFEPLPAGAVKPVVGFCGWLSGNRASLIRALQTEPRIQTNFILRDRFWGGKPHDPHLIREFNDNIRSSHFTVCSRGAGNFAIRFYQALAAGRIPVVVHDDMEYPYEDEIDWDNYLVRGGSNEEVIEKLMEFWRSKDIEQVQTDCRKIYQKYFLPKAFCKRALETLMTENQLLSAGPRQQATPSD